MSSGKTIRIVLGAPFDRESLRGGKSPFAKEFLGIIGDMIDVPHEMIMIEDQSMESQVKALRDADILICGTVAPEAVEAATRLKLIHSTGAGVDHMLEASSEAIAKKRVPVANVGGNLSIGVAEHAMGLVLALAKDIVNRCIALRDDVWDTHRGLLLGGKTLGIVGLGNTGVALAKMAKAFDMRVIATKRGPVEALKEELGLSFLGGPGDLKYVLENSDFVVICTPLTKETRGMIGETELKMMKRSAYLVNVARWSVVQEESLYRALKEGWIAGAGIDVWAASPNNPSTPSPLGINKLRNVVATPHVAGQTDQLVHESARTIAANVRRVYEGKAPVNIVDIAKGY